eukprot:TRINITY_DN123248_c0_g1_i1.p1 TRINITY_DN123248_c0_g1~~TRINITY_DN123248_c0_g1_i1.p1  ORF type:complete len:656 (-),score=140.72 TRINITY_DN123248_c0_g1_i1:174-2141(-)
MTPLAGCPGWAQCATSSMVDDSRPTDGLGFEAKPNVAAPVKRQRQRAQLVPAAALAATASVAALNAHGFGLSPPPHAGATSSRAFAVRPAPGHQAMAGLRSLSGSPAAHQLQGAGSFSPLSHHGDVRSPSLLRQMVATRRKQLRRQTPASPSSEGRAASSVQRSAIASALFMGTCRQFWMSPLAYITIPVVAALVGYGTNWVGVKMIFYPIGFWGIPIKRWEENPMGLIGWQGIVPCKVRKMSTRLVDIITEKLLSVSEAFEKVDPTELANLLEPEIAKAIEKDAPWGEAWLMASRPFLKDIVLQLSKNIKVHIEELLDLRGVVYSAFQRDKILLGELFQKAGKRELEFLVNSGAGFGFALGLVQMALWILLPNNWVLPIGGALVGYITNWVAIKLIFDPVEPTRVGPFTIQGLFEKRQPEVSEDFAVFLAERVLYSGKLIDDIANGANKARFEELVRESLPSVVPPEVREAAVGGFRKLAFEDRQHPVNRYIDDRLELESRLKTQLKALSSAEFENLLHPVFQEDETTLIIAGGVLGAAAGAAQCAFGWGGPPTGGVLAQVLQQGSYGTSAQAASLMLPLLSAASLGAFKGVAAMVCGRLLQAASAAHAVLPSWRMRVPRKLATRLSRPRLFRWLRPRLLGARASLRLLRDRLW